MKVKDFFEKNLKPLSIRIFVGRTLIGFYSRTNLPEDFVLNCFVSKYDVSCGKVYLYLEDQEVCCDE